MRSSKLNQGSELNVNDIVNKKNTWLFSGTEISKYLLENDRYTLPNINGRHTGKRQYFKKKI